MQYFNLKCLVQKQAIVAKAQQKLQRSKKGTKNMFKLKYKTKFKKNTKYL